MKNRCTNYSPDLQAQGDCINCGNTWERHVVIKSHCHPLLVLPEGFEALCDIRAGDPPPVTETTKPDVQLLAAIPSEECGCPEELWRIDRMNVLIHFEENGASEMFIYAGDFEMERTTSARNMMELRSQMFAWLGSLDGDAC